MPNDVNLLRVVNFSSGNMLEKFCEAPCIINTVRFVSDSNVVGIIPVMLVLKQVSTVKPLASAISLGSEPSNALFAIEMVLRLDNKPINVNKGPEICVLNPLQFINEVRL